MRRTLPFFLLSFLLLASCSSLESALQTGVLGGKSAIRDRNAIRLETVNFPGSTILAVAGVPGKHAFVLVRQAPEGLILTELDVRTGKTDWSRTLRLPTVFPLGPPPDRWSPTAGNGSISSLPD